jgi:hypothetical protein
MTHKQTLPHGTATTAKFTLAIHPEKMLATIRPLILLIDCSYSMSHYYDEKTRFAYALDVVRQFDTTERPIYVIGFGETQPPIIDSIKDLMPHSFRTLLTPALEIALNLDPHHLVLITDGVIDDSALARDFITTHMLSVDGVICADDPAGIEILKYVIGPGSVTRCTPKQLSDTVLLLTN